ncbi:hypothetical protein [Cohnella sp. 56]|uniref:hypothetical protein n=1 Tax=Cohnella sp. 56 TaxID=3113722 RepID=UPI0030EA4993
MKLALTGTPVMENASHIIMQEGEATVTYSRQYYRLSEETSGAGEPIAIHMTDKLPLQLSGNDLGHRIAVPVIT